MKNKTLLILAFVALPVTLCSSAIAQRIVGHTSLGSNVTSLGNQIFSLPNPSTNKIYVDETPAPGIVTVIDATSRAILTTIAVGPGSSEIRVNPTTNTIYAFSGESQAISVIDGSADAVVATIPPIVGGSCLSGIAVDTSANQIAVLDQCSQVAHILDGSTYIPLGTVSVPLNLMGDHQINPTTHVLYVVDDVDHEFVAANLATSTSTLVNLVTLWPQSVAIDAALNRIYMADNVLSSIYVFDGATNAMINSFKPPTDPYNVEVNQKNHIVSISDGFETIYFYRAFNLALDGQVTFHTPAQILSFSVNSATNLAYVGVLPQNVLVFIKAPTS